MTQNDQTGDDPGMMNGDDSEPPTGRALIMKSEVSAFADSNGNDDGKPWKKKSSMKKGTNDKEELRDIGLKWGMEPADFEYCKGAGGNLKSFEASIRLVKEDVSPPWYDCVIIKHTNGLLIFWNIFVSFLTIVSCFSNLHVAAFSGSHHHDIGNAHENWVVFWQMLQEAIFGIDILIIFFTEFRDDTTGEYNRIFSSIACNYLKGHFIFDFLSFFPFFEIFRHQMVEDDGEDADTVYNFYHLLYLFRLLRIYKAAQITRPNYVFSGYKRLHKAYLDWRHHQSHDCDSYEHMGLSKVDSVGIDVVTTAEFAFLITRMLFIIVLLSCSVGMFFYLFVQIEEWFYIQEAPLRSHDKFESFHHSYDMHANSDDFNTLIVIYYSLTTLSSVGFGDYSPVTTAERCFIVGVFMMMLIVFSTIIDSLQGYFMDFKASFEDPDDSALLREFFKFMKRYNNGVDLDPTFVHRVEDYFERYWEDHKINRITRDAVDKDLFGILPSYLQITILNKFVFYQFVEKYQRMFNI